MTYDSLKCRKNAANRSSVLRSHPTGAAGESILWAAQPNTSGIFHREDVYLIPFSLLWGGFAIFWEAGVTGFWGQPRTHPAPAFFMLWGIPFVVIGQYMIGVGSSLPRGRSAEQFYALTNRRAVVVQDGWSRKTASAYLVLGGTRVENPSFYEQLRRMGFTNLPDLSRAAVTFCDVVVPHQPILGRASVPRAGSRRAVQATGQHHSLCRALSSDSSAAAGTMAFHWRSTPMTSEADLKEVRRRGSRSLMRSVRGCGREGSRIASTRDLPSQPPLVHGSAIPPALHPGVHCSP